jgi:uncharacterized coiled-coil protein SlyX
MSKEIKVLGNQIDHLREDLRALGDKLLAMMEKQMSDLNELRREIAEQRDVVDATITLIKGLREKIANAGTDPAAIQELVTELDAQTARLASAVAENTPAQPPVVPSEPVPSTPVDTAPPVEQPVPVEPAPTEPAPADLPPPDPGEPRF